MGNIQLCIPKSPWTRCSGRLLLAFMTENARICGVSAAIRHRRCVRRRTVYDPGPAAERRRQCPRCHGRARTNQRMHICRVSTVAMSTLHAAGGTYSCYHSSAASTRQGSAQQPRLRCLPCSHRVFSAFGGRGCTEVKSTSKVWPCLSPPHRPGRKHTRRFELEEWQLAIVRKYPGEFAKGLFHPDGRRGVDRVRQSIEGRPRLRRRAGAGTRLRADLQTGPGPWRGQGACGER